MNPVNIQPELQTEQAVQRRYSAASQQKETALCCPVVYDDRYLQVIPKEIIERDYGCGDPSPYVRPGDTVLDLGSGAGKLCYIIAQLVGEAGAVIGVDVNADMLALARSHQAAVSDKIGYRNIAFKRGRIQDLALDLDLLAEEIGGHEIQDGEDALQLLQRLDSIRRERPMIASESVDCIVSNCVLNLVHPADRQALFAEMYRVLKPGGRAAISDIVASQDVPADMQKDPELWSGCISGAWREDRFVEKFVGCGFQGARLDHRQMQPWKTIDGIEFRSVTVLAFKPFHLNATAPRQTVMYRGPFQQVIDDEGNAYRRGEHVTVDEATGRLLGEQTFANTFYQIGQTTTLPGGGLNCCPDVSGRLVPSPGTQASSECKTNSEQQEDKDRGGCC